MNYGGRRIDRSQVLADLRRRDAAALLERNGVRSHSACYVNPNARCPVCGDAVFFYANQHGSRVYFDELGQPWTKHPCTDNPRHRMSAGTGLEAPPVRRPRGLAQELVAAARTAALFGQAGGDGAGWRLLIVITRDIRGERHVVVAESLDSAPVRVTFSYLAVAPLIGVGDFVSMKGDLISFLNRDTLDQITFRNGAALGPVVEAAPPPAAPPRVAAPKIQGQTSLIRRSIERASTPEMTEAETGHFHSTRINVAQLCDRLGPVVKSYARLGTRKPPDVAARLNRDGHKTAAGAPWTSRLARFLLALVFSDASRPREHDAAQPRRTACEDRPQPPAVPADLAARLSALGRVIVKRK
ncbi:hypothetical protein NKJ90_19220 [Mesorhizobium sp. M0051]|uniref:hypothetical protein n=1 Tax=Mesorhizobium sp. M0051 TaxID=2956862 RepID=UPI003339799F